MGDQGFRAKQVDEWLWARSRTDFAQLTNLRKPVRVTRKNNFDIRAVKVRESQVSSDKTIKRSFTLYDGNVIEGVLIPTPDRMTACVSSQVGCSLTCKFCATGYMERKRNLQADEIYDQVVLIANQAEEKYRQPLTNIVYM